MTIPRLAARIGAAALVAALPACGGSAQNPAAPGPKQALIVFTFEPNPLLAQPSQYSSGYDVAFNWSFRETAGVGGTLTVLQMTVLDGNGRLLGGHQWTPGLNYPFAAFGGATVRNEPVINSIHMVVPAGQGATFTMSYRVSDDKGNTFSSNVVVEVK
jgi:hypothetical protein